LIIIKKKIECGENVTIRTQKHYPRFKDFWQSRVVSTGVLSVAANPEGAFCFQRFAQLVQLYQQSVTPIQSVHEKDGLLLAHSISAAL